MGEALSRESDDELGSHAGGGLHTHGATVVFGNNEVGNRKTEPRAHPYVLGGEKWFEHTFAHIFGHTRTVVLDFDLNGFRVGAYLQGNTGISRICV